uniref:Uncharacterized protein n=1 Tax=Pinguiococcus pyrenoidosus TaxID=172671 RepID=A0A7R9U0P2_9STRA
MREKLLKSDELRFLDAVRKHGTKKQILSLKGALEKERQALRESIADMMQKNGLSQKSAKSKTGQKRHASGMPGQAPKPCPSQQRLSKAKLHPMRKGGLAMPSAAGSALAAGAASASASAVNARSLELKKHPWTPNTNGSGALDLGVDSMTLTQAQQANMVAAVNLVNGTSLAHGSPGVCQNAKRRKLSGAANQAGGASGKKNAGVKGLGMAQLGNPGNGASSSHQSAALGYSQNPAMLNHGLNINMQALNALSLNPLANAAKAAAIIAAALQQRGGLMQQQAIHQPVQRKKSSNNLAGSGGAAKKAEKDAPTSGRASPNQGFSALTPANTPNAKMPTECTNVAAVRLAHRLNEAPAMPKAATVANNMPSQPVCPQRQAAAVASLNVAASSS